jgi:hypothetical protein
MMTRQQFLRSLVGLGAGAFVVACSKSDGSPEPAVDAKPIDAKPIDAPMTMPDGPTNSTCATTMTAIGANHGHTAMVPGADVMAGVEKMYNIQGASGHPHMITITAQMFAMLKAGNPVTVTSSLDANHTHTVTVTCA